MSRELDRIECKKQRCALWDDANKACCFISLTMELMKRNEEDGL
jgi:hypothetical protein